MRRRRREGGREYEEGGSMRRRKREGGREYEEEEEGGREGV